MATDKSANITRELVMIQFPKRLEGSQSNLDVVLDGISILSAQLCVVNASFSDTTNAPYAFADTLGKLYDGMSEQELEKAAAGLSALSEMSKQVLLTLSMSMIAKMAGIDLGNLRAEAERLEMAERGDNFLRHFTETGDENDA